MAGPTPRLSLAQQIIKPRRAKLVQAMKKEGLLVVEAVTEFYNKRTTGTSLSGGGTIITSVHREFSCSKLLNIHYELYPFWNYIVIIS